MGVPIAPHRSCHVLEFTTVNKRVVSWHLRVGDRSLTVISDYGPNSSAGFGGGPHITQAEVTEAVRKRLGGKAPGVEEIRPEYLNRTLSDNIWASARREEAIGVSAALLCSFLLSRLALKRAT